MTRQLITPPIREPVSLAEVKSQLRIDATDDDNLLQGLITAARQYCEDFQNRAFLEQTWDLWLDDFPCEGYITIPLPPLQSVASIKYYDADDVEYTMAIADYIVDAVSDPGRIALTYGKTWPSIVLRPIKGVVVRFTTGYNTYSSTVTTNTLAVTKTAGDEFQPTWPVGKTVTINGVTYRIASVATASGLTLATTAGAQTGVAFLADDVPETVKQAMILHIKLLYDDYRPDERARLEVARDALLRMRRVWPV